MLAAKWLESDFLLVATCLSRRGLDSNMASEARDAYEENKRNNYAVAKCNESYKLQRKERTNTEEVERDVKLLKQQARLSQEKLNCWLEKVCAMCVWFIFIFYFYFFFICVDAQSHSCRRAKQ
jgi:hypothetical protein